MIYKNSIRLLFYNFNLVWKIMLYTILALACVTGLAYISAVPVFNTLTSNGFFELINKIINDFVTNLNLINFIQGLGDILNSFVSIIFNNFNKLWIFIVLFVFVVVFLGRFLIGLTKLTTNKVLYSSMSSNLKVGFLSSLFSNFGKTVLLELIKFVITFPIDIIIGYVIIQCFKLFSFGGAVAILTPFIIVLVAVILISIRVSIFSCWMPLMAVKNDGIFKCLKNNFIIMSRRFFKIFANSVGIILTIIMINGFALVFTLGVGLLVTVPLSMVLISTFQMSSFYSSYGMRYYVDIDIIVEPKRLEATEKFSRTKYLI